MLNPFHKLSFSHFSRSEEGQALALTCFGLTVLLMMAGLGIDVGYLRYQKQQMQKAADSAALATAEALNLGDTWANAMNAGYADAIANGYQNGTNGIIVLLHDPPTTPGDPFAGKNGYVEAIISQTRPTFFMKAQGWGSANVSSRAVATLLGNGSGCIYALDHGGTSGALHLNGHFSVSSGCGIYVNSTSSSALNIDGNGYINAGSAGAGIGVVGPGDGTGWRPGGPPYCAGSGFCPEPVNIPRFSDPLIAVAPPPPPTDCVHVQSGNDYYPGTYCGGISITTGGTYTFHSGLFILCNGGLHIGPGATVHGNAVTFYNTGHVGGVCPLDSRAPITVAGANGSFLTAPTDGSGCTTGANGGCPGILFFQDRNYISNLDSDASGIDGTGGARYTGAVYFPGTKLTYSGAPHIDVSSVIIAWRIEINNNVDINNSLLLGGGSPLKTAALAE